MPYPHTTFSGYRHLQEYFSFPEKYLFVDVSGGEYEGAGQGIDMQLQ